MSTKKDYKICYITAKAPYGLNEMFIIDEMIALKKYGIKLIIFTRDENKKIYHNTGKILIPNTFVIPIINAKIIILLITSLFFKKEVRKVFYYILKNSRNIRILFKNLYFFPKSLYITKIIKDSKTDHIHAHWGSTTSTMAFIIAELTNIPWSFTLHRWDIYENNLLNLKIKSAKFVRCISQKGKKDTLKIIGEKYNSKIKVIHMGVKIPKLDFNKIKSKIEKFNRNKQIKLVFVGSLIKVKGTIYLIDAIKKLVKLDHENVRVDIYGIGELREKLEEKVSNLGIRNNINFKGYVSNNILLKAYMNCKYDIIILPSISYKNTYEGIPVSLIEAMSYGIPVISTRTGSISELLDNKCGIIIEDKNADSISRAIIKLIKNPNFTFQLVKNAYSKVSNSFSYSVYIKLMNEIMKYK